jgi:hypothetical protein
MTTSGMIILGFIYGIWLITLPPFSVYDSVLMWFYAWFLDWGNSVTGVFLVGLYFCIDIVFVYLKYFFIAHIVSSIAFAGIPV